MRTHYRDQAGRVVVSSPWKHLDHWRRTRDFDPGDVHAGAGRPANAQVTA